MRNIIMQVVFLTLLLASSVAESVASPVFYSTTNPADHWYVSTNVAGTDGLGLSGFNTTSFSQAVAITGREGFIADNSSGSHDWRWTYFIFRQTFDLSGYDPTTANLQFQWAADDSGEIFAIRGSWIPKFSLNGNALINYPGSTPDHRIATYDYSSTVNITTGFVAGLNTIDFYVEGNGMTDGFALKTFGFTASPITVAVPSVPEPSTFILLGAGLAAAGFIRRRHKA